MTFLFTPGNALGCVVNAHRSQWDGSICSKPADWDCSAPLEFRRDFCAKDMPRCYHHRLFRAQDPWFETDDNGAGWILQTSPHAFDDQILLLWAQETFEPGGIRNVFTRHDRIVGLYRMKSVERLTIGHRIVWRVYPHPQAWIRLNQFGITVPRWADTGGPYIKQVDRGKVLQVMEDVTQRVADGRAGWASEMEADRFTTIRNAIDEWFEIARESAMVNLPVARPTVTGSRPVATVGPAARSPLAALKDVVRPSTESGPRIASIERSPRKTDSVAIPVVAVPEAPGAPTVAPPVAPTPPALAPAAAPAVPTPPPVPDPLIDPSRYGWIEKDHGTETLNALVIASLTKPFIILSGSPGVGKSHLAVNLIDDPVGDRVYVVAVSATWRGREDALGYVNPLTSEFEPTGLTTFLFRAADAWQKGDRRAFLVVFEEFNLSQPEHWLSDILVVSQFKDDARRYISLDGKSVRGRPAAQSALLLSPSVHFVATINRDHTTRSLSPRVIDRSAVVELSLSPKEALARAGVKVGPEQEDAIADLDFVLRPKAVSFSIRSAQSLQRALPQAAALLLDTWQVVDLVLVQEVLSKVQLMAKDPRDEGLLRALEEWVKKPERRLNRCAVLIGSWRERIDAALDIGST